MSIDIDQLVFHLSSPNAVPAVKLKLCTLPNGRFLGHIYRLMISVGDQLRTSVIEALRLLQFTSMLLLLAKHAVL